MNLTYTICIYYLTLILYVLCNIIYYTNIPNIKMMLAGRYLNMYCAISYYNNILNIKIILTGRYLYTCYAISSYNNIPDIKMMLAGRLDLKLYITILLTIDKLFQIVILSMLEIIS